MMLCLFALPLQGVPDRPGESPPAIRLGIIFGLALAIRLVGVWAWEWRFGQEFVFGDSESYWHLARCLARGEVYCYGEYGTIFRTPGYPLVLSPLFWAFDNPPLWLARVEGAVLGAVAVLLLCHLAERIFDPKVARLAGLIAAVHPEMVLSSLPILSEAAFLPVWIGHLYLLAAAGCVHITERQQTLGRWGVPLLAGGLAGLATLIRPSTLLWLPFAMLLDVVLLRRFSRAWRLWIAAGLGFCAAMFPWWLRNYALTGRVILTTTQVGASLYDGLNPSATGGSDMRFVAEKLQALKQQYPQAEAIWLEIALDQQLKQEALDWARANPGRTLRLAITKFLRFWNIVPNDPGFNRFPINVLIAVFAVGVFSLALWAVVRYWRKDGVLLVCLAPAVYFMLLHLVFVSSIRYRVPAIPGLIILASAGLINVFSNPSRRQPADGKT